MHQRVGEGVGIFRQIEAGGIEPVKRIIAGSGLSRHAERTEPPNLAFGGTDAGGDAGVPALWIYADYRPVEQQQVGNDRADLLAQAGGCHREQMRRTVVMQQFAAHRCSG